MVRGQHPARGRRPCQGESTVYVESDDEYNDDAAGSSIAYSSVFLWLRGRNTVLGLKYFIHIQIKQKRLHHKHTNSQRTRSH